MSSAAMLVSAPWRRVPWIPWIRWALKNHMAIFERFFFQNPTEIGGSMGKLHSRFVSFLFRCALEP